MVSGKTVVHGVIGALVSIVLSFVPFSTAIGGAVAGFLEGPDDRAGVVAGGVAGAIAFVPVAALAVGLLALVGIGTGAAAVPLEGFAVVLVPFAIGSSLALLYTVGFAALGGYVGAALARRYPETRQQTRHTVGFDDHRPTRPPRAGSTRRRPSHSHDRTERSVAREPVSDQEGEPTPDSEPEEPAERG